MKTTLFSLFLLLLLVSCGDDDGNSSGANAPQGEESFEILTDGSDVVWGFDFLPDQRIIFSERQGQIKILTPSTGDVQSVSGLPSISTLGESGLMDLKLHPLFSQNQLVYFCYTEASASGRAVALGRGTLQNNALVNFQRIFISNEANNSDRHFGCRMRFETNNTLFMTIGDQNEPNQAQSLASHLGKILRLNADGTAPSDNPFVGTPGALPEIWSLGHRNPQGLDVNPATGELFSSEHGPIGGDELNIIQKGENYGWPLETSGQMLLGPIETWTPAIAPSGIAFWRGELFMACLRGQQIRRLTLSGATVTNQIELFSNQNTRFRNVSAGPGGLLYFSTDDGKIGRIR